MYRYKRSRCRPIVDSWKRPPNRPNQILRVTSRAFSPQPPCPRSLLPSKCTPGRGVPWRWDGKSGVASKVLLRRLLLAEAVRTSKTHDATLPALYCTGKSRRSLKVCIVAPYPVPRASLSPKLPGYVTQHGGSVNPQYSTQAKRLAEVSRPTGGKGLSARTCALLSLSPCCKSGRLHAAVQGRVVQLIFVLVFEQEIENRNTRMWRPHKVRNRHHG